MSTRKALLYCALISFAIGVACGIFIGTVSP